MTRFEPEWWQEELDAPRPHDDTPVPVRYYNLVKCMSIVSAYHDGQEAFSDAVRFIVYYLQSCALKTVHGEHYGVNPDDIWREHLADLPWPPPNNAPHQPDHTT